MFFKRSFPHASAQNFGSDGLTNVLATVMFTSLKPPRTEFVRFMSPLNITKKQVENSIMLSPKPVMLKKTKRHIHCKPSRFANGEYASQNNNIYSIHPKFNIDPEKTIPKRKTCLPTITFQELCSFQGRY